MRVLFFNTEGMIMTLRKTMVTALLAGTTVLAMSSANAFFGNWGPWDWFDDDDWYDYPPPGYYGGYPGYGYGGHPGYGYGGYPGYGYGGYPGYGYGGYPGYGYGGYPAYGAVPPQPAAPAAR